MNVASRLCNAADPDCIVLSDACLKRAGASYFPSQPLPPMTLKGRQAPLITHVIRGV